MERGGGEELTHVWTCGGDVPTLGTSAPVR